MKLILFGGTTEGRLLAWRLAQNGHAVTVSVATELGAEELRNLSGIQVLTGRRDRKEIAALLPEFACCIDATHPYAVDASRNIRSACLDCNLPYYRLKREESALESGILMESAEAAADWLLPTEGRVLLTTGAKELPAFRKLPGDRLFARVLPTHQGIDACEALGLAHSHILALQGPFTQEMNEAMLRQYDIRYLVTKDGGSAGGFPEKLAAARETGTTVLVISRPAETGLDMETLIQTLEGTT